MTQLSMEIEQEEDGRWIADVMNLPGAMAYGPTREKAIAAARVLALRILADRIEHGEELPELSEVFPVVA